MKPPRLPFQTALTSSPSFGLLNRKVALHFSPWVLGLAFLGLPRLVQAQDVTSGTAIYTTNWAGGTIDSGATLQLDDGGTVSGNVTNNGTLQYNKSGNLTISNTVAGTGTLSLTGSGILTLTGANTYTGATTVSAGVLNIQNANALGTKAAGTSVTSGAALQIQGGITTAEEPLTLSGTGVSADGALRNISGTNTYAGLVTLGAATRINSDAGTLTLSNAGTITGAGLGLTVGGAGNTTISSIIGTTTGTLTKDGAGTLTLTKTNTFSGGLTVGASAGSVIAYTNAGTNLTALGSGAVAIGSGSTLELNSQNTGLSATVINNTFTGTGLLKLSSSSTSGNNNFLGDINGFSGTVELAYIGKHNNILTGSSAARTSVINAPNATLQINSGNTLYVGYYGSQTWKDIKVSGSGNAEGFGAIRFDTNRTLTVTGSVSLLGDTTIGTGGGTLNGAITSGAGGTQTLTLGTSKTTTGVVTLSGAIGGGIGSIALNKTQGNSVILSGANTYTGATTVSAGVLNIQNANALGTKAAGTSVTSGAALQIQGGITTAEEPLTLNGTGVSNNGALRNISGNNTYAGLVTLGATTRINSDAGTLTLSNAGTVTGAGLGLTVGGAGNTTISSIIGTTTGTLTKDGTGTLILSGANTFTGATTVSAGALNIQNANALGTVATGTSVTSGAALQIQGGITTAAEALTLNGSGVGTDGALRNISGDNTYAGLVTLGAATRINSDAGTLTLNNVGTITGSGLGLTVGGAGNTTIASIIGTTSGTLTKDGAGTLTLSGANTYTGGTTLTAGTLALGSAGAIGSSGTISFGGGTLQASASNTIDYSARFSNAASQQYKIDTNGQNLTLATALTSSGGSFTKLGSGTLTLSGANTYTGGTTIIGGTLTAGHVNAFGTGALTIGADTFLDLANYNIANTLTNNGGTILNAGTIAGGDFSGGTTSLSGANSTVAAVTGTATVNISGTDTAITTVSGGTVNVNAAGTDTAITTVSGGTLNVNAAGTTIQSYNGGDVAVGAGLAVTINEGTSSGTISGAGGLTKAGSGTMALSGSNSFSGALTVSAGIVNVQNATGLGTTAGSTTVRNGATLQLQGGITVGAEGLSLNGGAASGQTGALVNVSGTNTYGGAVTVTASSSISAASGSVLNLTGGVVKNGTVATFNGGGTINVNTVAISGYSANSDLVIDGTTVNLGVASTYNGPTFIRNSGTLNANVTDALPTANGRTAVTFDGTGTSVLSLGAAQSVASLTSVGAATVTLGGNTLTVGTSTSTDRATFAGVISGSGGLIKDGASTQTLTGANTYMGTTTISGGTLEVSGTTGALSAASAVNINGGTLLLKGSAANRISDTEAISLGAADSKLQLSGAVTETLGALTLAGGAGARVIDFGATIGDSGELTFASLTGDSSLPLQIWNWSGTIGTGGGTDRFIISNGPAPSNVSFFNGAGTGLYSGATVFTASNELVPVPEASTLLGVLGLMAPLAWRERRHWMRCREARR